MLKPTRLFMMTLLGSILSGCAPDSLDNLQAKGFDAYLNTLQRQCKDFYIGSHNIQGWLQYNGQGMGDQYTYWLDMTSRLYYKRIDMGQYRSGVENSLGSGPHNKQSFACIELHLPAGQPEPSKGFVLP